MEGVSHLSLSLSYDGNNLFQSISLSQEQDYFLGNKDFMDGLKILSGFKTASFRDDEASLPRLFLKKEVILFQMSLVKVMQKILFLMLLYKIFLKNESTTLAPPQMLKVLFTL